MIALPTAPPTGTGVRGRRRLPTALAVLLASLVVSPSPPGAAAKATRAADRARVGPRSLGEEFVAWRRARPPQAATQAGAPAVPLTALVSASALSGELAWLRGFRDRLAALPREARDARSDAPARSQDAFDRALLEAAVEHALAEREILKPFERDPGAYVALVAGSVEAVLDRSGGSPCARLQRAARRLAEVPEVLRAARLNLKHPSRVLTERAIGRYEGVLRFYRQDVPQSVTGCRNARLQADLAQADTAAVRAIEAFLGYLREDLLPAARDEPIGAEACLRLLRADLVAEVAPVETLLAGGARRVEARRAELETIARLVSGPGMRGTRAALDALESEGSPVTIDSVRWDLAHAVEFLRAQGIVTLPSRLALEVREAPSFRADGTLRLADPGVRGPFPRPGWLELGAFEGPDQPDHRLNRWESALTVAREGLPGRWMRTAVIAERASELRQGLLETWSGEDWGAYAEQMILDAGFGAEDPRYRLAGALRALRGEGRSLAALAVHSGAMSADEARRMLVDRCLVDDDEADREMRSVAADPALMGYSLGAQRLRELQDEARRRLGPRYRTRTFHDAVLRCGASPPGILPDLLWRELAEATGDEPVGAKP